MGALHLRCPCCGVVAPTARIDRAGGHTVEAITRKGLGRGKGFDVTRTPLVDTRRHGPILAYLVEALDRARAQVAALAEGKAPPPVASAITDGEGECT